MMILRRIFRKPLRATVLLARTEAALRSKRMNDLLIAEHERALEMSSTDSVTGIHSRAYMEELLSAAAAAARRYNIRFDRDDGPRPFAAINEHTAEMPAMCVA